MPFRHEKTFKRDDCKVKITVLFDCYRGKVSSEFYISKTKSPKGRLYEVVHGHCRLTADKAEPGLGYLSAQEINESLQEAHRAFCEAAKPELVEVGK